MAIIYSYPKKTTPNAGDLLVITDSAQPAPNKNRTKSLTLGDLATYVITSQSAITGSGTINTIPVFTGTTSIGDSGLVYTTTGGGSAANLPLFNFNGAGNADINVQRIVAIDYFGNNLSISNISAGNTGTVTLNGDTIIGNASTDTLTVGATSTFNAPARFNGTILDSTGGAGTAGQVLSSTGTATSWISDGGGTVTGTGTPDSVTVFKTASEIYTPVNTTAIAGKSFLQRISQTNATIELGASTSFTDLNEGLEIYPNTTHFTTRVTPWLEIFAYEDPSANPLNTYNSAYDGSAFVVGKSNTIGDASSSNLAIVGFNNTLKGNKMMIVGQTNSVDGTNNTGSLVVGVSNSIATTGTIKNSLIAGQNIGVPVGITATIDTSFITGRGNAAQGSISRCIMSGDDNDARGIENSFISGARNEIVNGSNSAIAAGQNNQIGNGNSTSTNNNFIAGENNNLGILSGSTSNKDSFILGRGNTVAGLIGGAFGSGNGVYSDVNAGTSIAIGQNNSVGSSSTRVRNAIAIGTQNNVDDDYEIQIGRGLDTISTNGGSYVLVGRNNDQINYSLASLSCSFIVGASTLGGGSGRRNALVVTNKTAFANESNVILPGVGEYRNYANEAAAKAGGVPLYGLYHTDGVVHIVYTP